MIYTPLTKLAMKIAYKAHHGQTDKSGIPYIYHPIHLAEQMDDEKSTCVALLHDVVEDTDITLENIAEYGFDSDIIDALRLMTHDKSMPYLDYVWQIKSNPIASKVKQADLIHNSDLTRIDAVDEQDLRRKDKYQNALYILTEQLPSQDDFQQDGKLPEEVEFWTDEHFLSQEKEGFYGKELIKTLDKIGIGSCHIYNDRYLKERQLKIQLEDTRYWFLTMFVSYSGEISHFSLDYEAASDSHWQFPLSAVKPIRDLLYMPWDDCLSFYEILIKYIDEKSGFELLERIKPFITAQYHF